MVSLLNPHHHAELDAEGGQGWLCWPLATNFSVHFVLLPFVLAGHTPPHLSVMAMMRSLVPVVAVLLLAGVWPS
jgi:hypothetical protein